MSAPANAISPPLADLYWFQYINPALNSVTPTNLFMTSAPYPISIPKLQVTAGPYGVQTVNATFLPSRIKRAAEQNTQPRNFHRIYTDLWRPRIVVNQVTAAEPSFTTPAIVVTY